MKFIIIGLGNFGSSLAEKLTRLGHEVIGVDNKMGKVEAIKERITHAVCLNSTDPQAMTNLPLNDADIVIVAIGEDEGANIMATALMKQFKVKRLISRAVSALHETVLEAMGVDEIVHPEEETAERWAKKLNIQGVIDTFELAGEYNIVEAEVPSRYIGKTLAEIEIRKNYDVVVLTTIKTTEKKNVFGIARKVKSVQGVASAKTIFDEGDIVVFYGNINDIKRLLKKEDAG